MSKRAAIIGVADHFGWAVFVTATRDGSLLDRRRVALVDKDLPSDPHHHKAQRLPLDQALALIERVRLSAERHAKLALDAVESTVTPSIEGIAMRECPKLPPTVAERIRDYRAQNVADSVMYRHALAGAAQARDWTVHWYDARKVLDAASDALQIEDLDSHFVAMRKSIGPPWGRDQRVAMAAAIVAARASFDSTTK